LPDGYCARILPRSSIGLKDIGMHHGLIDCDYQGELMIIIKNTSKYNFEIKKG